MAKKRDRTKVKPRRNGDKCTYCSFDPPYLVLYRLIYRRCPRCLEVSATRLTSPFYRSL